jgi:hypothetical protein
MSQLTPADAAARGVIRELVDAQPTVSERPLG